MRCHYLLLILTFIYLTGCTTTFSEDPLLWTYNQGSLPEPNISLKIKGLGPCTDNPDRTLKLNSNAPTTIPPAADFAPWQKYLHFMASKPPVLPMMIEIA